MSKAVKIKQSDVPKIKAWIAAHVKPSQQAAAWTLVETLLSSFTKLEQKFGFDLVLEVAEAVAPVRPPPQIQTEEPEQVNGPRLTKVWARSNRVLGFALSSGFENWPTKVEDGKTLIGVMRCNGRKFDWVSTGNIKGQQKTVENLFHGKYRQGIAKGETVSIDVTDIHGKRPTNAVSFVWPWEGT